MSAQAHADHGAPTSFVRRWLYSTNHKDIGTMYLVFAILAAFIGGGLSIYMRMELMEPGVQYMEDGHVWNVFTTAHGLIMVFFVVMPGLIGGFGNWFVPIHDRRAGYGVPADEQHFLLAAAAVLHPAAAVGCHGWRRRCRLDDLSAAVLKLGNAGHVDGSGDLLAAPGRCVVDPRRGKLHHHHLQHAHPRHDAPQNAAVRMGDAGHGLPAAAGSAGSCRCHHHAADRPEFRHHLLHPRRRRRPDPVPAPLLVLRPPRGLHHDPARLRHCQPHHLDLLEEAGLRLSRHGLCDGGDRLYRLHRLGAPHVYGGPQRRHAGLFHRGDDGDRGADRREDLLLDRDDVGWLDHLPRPDAVGNRLSSSCSPSVV